MNDGTVAATRVLAISSGGGHWVELRRLKRAFEGCEVTWVSTHPAYRDELLSETPEGEAAPRFVTVREANRWQKMNMVHQIFGVVAVLVRVRPDAIVSTGSSPGFFAVCLGKLFLGSRTVWVQSIADTEGMSMSGRMAGRFADLWLTQWDHLAKPDGPEFHGSVI